MWGPDGSRNPVPKQGAWWRRALLDPQGASVLSMPRPHGPSGESHIAMWPRVPFQVCRPLEAFVPDGPHLPYVP